MARQQRKTKRSDVLENEEKDPPGNEEKVFAEDSVEMEEEDSKMEANEEVEDKKKTEEFTKAARLNPFEESEEDFPHEVEGRAELNTLPTEQPPGSYKIAIIGVSLYGRLNGFYFKMMTKDGEPFIPGLRNHFQERVEHDFHIDSIGARGKKDGKNYIKMPNRDTGSDSSPSSFSWFCYINDGLEDAVGFVMNAAQVLNNDETYLNKFKLERTNGRKPYFEVVDVISAQDKKLSQFMFPSDVAKYVNRKHNLSNFGVRQRMNNNDWTNLMKRYFEDPKEGKRLVQQEISDIRNYILHEAF